MEAEEINKYINHFTPIYDKNGNEINPIPKNEKVTVWHGGRKDMQGFSYNIMRSEMGLEELTATSWILQEKLEELAS